MRGLARQMPLRMTLAAAVGALWLAAACSASHPFKIHNDTSESVVLTGCAQEAGLERTIPPRGSFTFTDNVGERVLSDDPGFACVLRTGAGQLVCLRLPTDQSKKTDFAVSEGQPTESLATCAQHSDPHL